MNEIHQTAGSSISDGELHAYLDGELTAARRAEVEAFLADSPEDAARVKEYRDLTLALHALGDETELNRNPEIDALTDSLEKTIGRRRLTQRLVRVAAVSAFIIAGFGAFTSYTDRLDAPEDRFVAFTQQATDAHLLFAGRLADAKEVSLDDKSRVVSWLSQRLTGIPLQAPDLEPFGYQLTVERILPSRNGPAAQLMYEHQKEQRPVTLFIGKNRDSGQTAFTFVQNSDVAVFYWQDGPFAYSLAGGLERQQLLELAEAISAQLNSVPPLPNTFVKRPGTDTKQAAIIEPPAPPIATKIEAVPQKTVVEPKKAAPADAPAIQPVSDQTPALPQSGQSTERVPQASPDTGKTPDAPVRPGAPLMPADAEAPKNT